LWVMDRAAQPGLATEGKEGGDPVISLWWVLAAFIGGACAGVLVISLLQMAGGLPEQSAHAPDLNGLRG
jgi:hypothetical protein